MFQVLVSSRDSADLTKEAIEAVDSARDILSIADVLGIRTSFLIAVEGGNLGWSPGVHGTHSSCSLNSTTLPS